MSISYCFELEEGLNYPISDCMTIYVDIHTNEK